MWCLLCSQYLCKTHPWRLAHLSSQNMCQLFHNKAEVCHVDPELKQCEEGPCNVLSSKETHFQGTDCKAKKWLMFNKICEADRNIYPIQSAHKQQFRKSQEFSPRVQCVQEAARAGIPVHAMPCLLSYEKKGSFTSKPNQLTPFK